MSKYCSYCYDADRDDDHCYSCRSCCTITATATAAALDDDDDDGDDDDDLLLAVCGGSSIPFPETRS